MQYTIGERFRLVLKSKGVNMTDFSRLVNIPTSTISSNLARNSVTYEMISKILAEYRDISPDWLLYEEGDMFRSSVVVPEAKKVNLFVEKPKKKDQEGGTPVETALIALTSHLSNQDALIDRLASLSAESQERLMAVNRIVEKLSELGATFADHMRKKDDECQELKREMKETKAEAEKATDLLNQIINNAFGDKGKNTFNGTTRITSFNG